MTSTEMTGIPITQTSYYSPALNAAIFDGPLRLYFSQYHESEALKIYFQIQERITEWKSFIRNDLKEKGINIYIMLYPDSDSFEMCFSPLQEKFSVQVQGMDKVLGIRGGLGAEDFTNLLSIFRDLVNSPSMLEAHA